jgi:hypothetical protein
MTSLTELQHGTKACNVGELIPHGLGLDSLEGTYRHPA